MNVVIKNAAQLKQAKEDLELLRRAWRKILAGGQEYEINGVNRMKHASLSEIANQISAYEAAIDFYETTKGAGGTSRRVIPID